MMNTIDTIKAEIAKLDGAWRRADAAGNEAEKNALSATYSGLVEELEDAAAELESDHLLGEHGPGAENADCPVCKRHSEAEAEMAEEARKINRFFENEPAAMSVVLERRSITGQLIGFELVFRSGARQPVATEAEAAELAEAWARIARDVTEEYCFLCNRATDHRGEHEPADLNNEGEER